MKRKYFTFYEGVHEQLQKEYDWFIRRGRNDKPFTPYYINGTFDEVIKDVLTKPEANNIQIVNCQWMRSPSVTIPAQYNICLVENEKVEHVEEYKFPNQDLYGYRKEGQWLMRVYSCPKTHNFIHWTLKSQERDEDMVIYSSRLKRELRYNGEVFKVHFGSGLNSNGTTVELGEDAPYDEREEIVIPILNQMREKRWNNAHEDIVQHLMCIYKINKAQVKAQMF